MPDSRRGNDACQPLQPAQTLVDSPQKVALRLAVAVQGLRTAWQEDAAVRNQVMGCAAMFLTLLLVRPPAYWWGLALFASLTCVALELINTALERAVDEVQPGLRESIGKLKDISAAAVVVCSFGVLIIGILMIGSEYLAGIDGPPMADEEPLPGSSV